MFVDAVHKFYENFFENLKKNACVKFTFYLDCKATLTKCVYRFNQSIMSLTASTIF